MSPPRPEPAGPAPGPVRRSRALSAASLALLLVSLSPQLGTAQRITGVRVQPTSPATLSPGDSVMVRFGYDIPARWGEVRIFVRPMTDGALSSNYAAGGSPLYSGTGSGRSWFTIRSGTAGIDQIRLQIVDQSRNLLRERFVPVELSFRAMRFPAIAEITGVLTLANHTVSDVDAMPTSPTQLRPGDFVTTTFTYRTTNAGGVRIFVRPMTDGEPSPAYRASRSPVYPSGSGEGRGSFTIQSDGVTVDQLRLEMYTPEGDELLHQSFVPVSYRYGAAAPAPEEPVVRIMPDGSIEETSPDGGRRVIRADGRIVFYPPGDTIGMMMLAIQIPPALPPGDASTLDAAWLELMDAWLDDVAESLLEDIRRITASEASMENYMTFEAENAATLYEIVDLRTRILERLVR